MTEQQVLSKLQDMKAELESLSAISQDARATVTLDQQSVGRLSRMDALQGQAMAQAAERQRRADIQRIDAAIRRLEEGDYGYCVACGDEISARRLAIDPAACFLHQLRQVKPARGTRINFPCDAVNLADKTGPISRPQ